MKSTVKTIAFASILALCASGAFAKTKVVTTTTVKTTTTSKVKEQPKKVEKAESKHHEEHRKRPNPNNRRRKNHHDEHISVKSHSSHGASRPHHAPDHRPAPVVSHKHGEKRPSAVVVREYHSGPSCVVEVDPAAVAAGAIVGGIIALTAIAAD